MGEWNQVQMPPAVLKAEWKEKGDGIFEITVSTDSFAQDVTIEILDEDVYYSDNSFCLESGESKTIQARITAPAGSRGAGKMRIRAYHAKPLCFRFTRGGNGYEIQAC